MEPITLEAEGLLLNRWQPSHLADLAKTYADKDIERFLVMPLPWAQKSRERHLDVMRRMWSTGNPQWAVTDHTGRFMGSVGLRTSGPKIYTITYLTAPWARNTGVAQRAVRAASAFAFDSLDAKRISWDAICGNHFSRLVAQRVGYSIEGWSRNAVFQRGVMRDVWFGGLVPGDIRSADQPPPGFARLKAQAQYFSRAQEELDTETPGLRLVPLSEEHLDDVTVTCQDEQSQKWTTVPANYTRTHSRTFLTAVSKVWERGETAVYALADAHGRYQGTIDLRLGGFHRSEGSVGYMSAPWARERGWMTAALRRICRLGFDDLRLEKINWSALANNEASLRVARKAGFTVEGTLRGHQDTPEGPREDMVIASLLPDQLN